MVEHTAAECVFGPANGGLFALHGAIGLGQVRRVAAYEPLLLRGGPDDAAIRRTFTTMQEMIRGGRMGEGIMFSIHESVDREVRRGHMSSWVGTAVHAFPSRVGAGLLTCSCATNVPAPETWPGGSWWPACPRSLTRCWTPREPWSSTGSSTPRCC